jgi:hypothetical protein
MSTQLEELRGQVLSDEDRALFADFRKQREAEALREKLGQGRGKTTVDVESIQMIIKDSISSAVKDVQEKYEAVLKRQSQDNESLRASITASAVREEVGKALSQASVQDEFRTVVGDLINARHRFASVDGMLVAVDDKGNPKSVDGKVQTPVDIVTVMRNELPSMFRPKGTNGTGQTGSATPAAGSAAAQSDHAASISMITEGLKKRGFPVATGV